MVKIESKISGNKIYRTKKVPHNTGKFKTPLPLTAACGDMEGEINLLWEPVAGAKAYVVQLSRGLKEPVRWKQEDVITKCSYTVSKLKSGINYWFRVAAAGYSGQGCWSKEVQKKAP